MITSIMKFTWHTQKQTNWYKYKTSVKLWWWSTPVIFEVKVHWYLNTSATSLSREELNYDTPITPSPTVHHFWNKNILFQNILFQMYPNANAHKYGCLWSEDFTTEKSKESFTMVCSSFSHHVISWSHTLPNMKQRRLECNKSWHRVLHIDS